MNLEAEAGTIPFALLFASFVFSPSALPVGRIATTR